MEYYKNLSLESIVYFCEIDNCEKTERWNDILGYEGLYMASDLGRIKSLERRVYTGKYNFIKKEAIKALTKTKHNRLSCGLCVNGKKKHLFVHQLVGMAFLGHKPSGHDLIIDHIDNNPLNNCINNIRIVSPRENASKDRVSTSKYVGVGWDKENNKWRSCIWINGKSKCLGRFTSEIEAAKAYLKALLKIKNEEISLLVEQIESM